MQNAVLRSASASGDGRELAAFQVERGIRLQTGDADRVRSRGDDGLAN